MSHTLNNLFLASIELTKNFHLLASNIASVHTKFFLLINKAPSNKKFMLVIVIFNRLQFVLVDYGMIK